jgi:hypothetical protein
MNPPIGLSGNLLGLHIKEELDVGRGYKDIKTGVSEKSKVIAIHES